MRCSSTGSEGRGRRAQRSRLISSHGHTTRAPTRRRSCAGLAATTASAPKRQCRRRGRARRACRADRQGHRWNRRPAALCRVSSATLSKIASCCGKPMSSSDTSLHLRRVAGQHLSRIADQEGIRDLCDPVAPESREHMVRHVLLIEDAGIRACRDRRRGPSRRAMTFSASVSPAAITSPAHRMVAPGGGQLGRVERLVPHHRVGPVLERAHHRRRDVARPRPHGDANDAVA